MYDGVGVAVGGAGGVDVAVGGGDGSKSVPHIINVAR